MSTGLGMSLDDAIQKRRGDRGGERGGRRFSKDGPGKFGGKRVFTKRFGRDREDRFNRDRPFKRDREDRPFKRDREDRPFNRDREDRPFNRDRGAPRRFGSDRKPRFSTRFIRRTGAPNKAFGDREEGAPKRFHENRENRESEGSGYTEGTKIKISNLDFNITHKDIMELFSKLGTVKKNKIIYDELGRSRGKAFVEFEKPENASNAIKEYNGAVLDGKTITVEYDDERAGRRSGLLRKPISRDNFQRRDDFRREPREDKFRSEGDWRREKREDRRDDDRPFRRRGGFRGGFRRNRY